MDNRISSNYTSTGSLIVTVSTAGGAIPLEGALVTIKGASPENSGVISVVYTDRSGRTPRILFPTPAASESEKPGTEKPYATYNIEVDMPNFNPQSYSNVPIFAGTTSIQPVNLVPLAEHPGETTTPDETDIAEYQNPDL